MTHGGSIDAQYLLSEPEQSMFACSIEYCATSVFEYDSKFKQIGDLCTSEHLGLGKAQFVEE